MTKKIQPQTTYNNNKATNSSHPQSRIVAVIKREPGESLGIHYQHMVSKSKVIITKVEKGLPAFKGGLRTNMEIISINNVNCQAKDFCTDDIKGLLKTEEKLVFVVKRPTFEPGTYITAAIERSEPTEPIGIGMRANGPAFCGGKTRITTITMNSLAYNTDLQVGMIIKSIDNVDCTKKTASQIVQLLNQATGTFTILAQVEPEETHKSEKRLQVAHAAPVTTITRTGVTNSSYGVTRPPPYGLPAGGTWRRSKHVGDRTIAYTLVGCLLFGVFGLIPLCLPCDERDVYIVNGQIYTPRGHIIDGNVYTPDGRIIDRRRT